MESVSAFIRHGTCVGLLDPLTARRYAGRGISVHPFDPPVIYKIALVVPRDRLRSAILEKFIETVKTEFTAL
jgi:DNA-binding transcriptional LysR family regulator